MMCKPRHELFNNPFEHSKRQVNWAQWDQHAIRSYVNLIVRIARVVVSPDFRGLGLARHLVLAAVHYAQNRWNIGGRRPLFLEISAEMLRYVDFVTSAGFHFVGWTEGNVNRIVADLSHMSKGYRVSCGIMSLQKKYVTAIQRYAASSHQPFEVVLERLRQITQSPDPAASLSPEEWAAFRSVLRLPRPYFLFPLDNDSRKYLAQNLKATAPAKYAGFKVKSATISLPSVAVRCSLVLQKTKNVRLIMDCFGLQGDILNSDLLPPLSVKASGGNIVLIVGPSGSGKSVLLTALDPQRRGANSNLQIEVKGDQHYSAGWIKPLPDDVPIFDYFAERYSPERAFAALSNTGLSEAFVFIKPFSLLSRGQQYRAMLAELLLREDQVWLLDEFCSDLDPISAKVVVHNFRRHVMSTGRIAFVAAANHRHYVDVLRPTQVILLRAGGRASVLSYKDYNDELFYKAV
jgi:ABC-type ATPase with predicted acetyltransferase domain